MTLDELDKLIREARTPRELFGDDLDATLRRFRAVCHPDRNPGDPRAEQLFKELHTLAEQARRPPVTLESPKRQYTLLKRIATGEVADIHLATANERDYLLKVSRIPGGASSLDNERRALVALLTAAGDTHYAKYFPTLAESFLTADRSEKRVNVFTWRPVLYTAEQVRQRHEAGLDGRHLAWSFKRLLTVVGFAHRHGWMHGAVLPSHVLIQPEEHGVVLVGWGHAVVHGEHVRTISAPFRDWYPVEVMEKRPALPATDIFLAAKCVVYLAGGDPATGHMPDAVPSAMQQFIRSCLLEGPRMRPDDAWKLLDEFDELLRALYGPPKFHHLSMS
jgi:hypothetical protein